MADLERKIYLISDTHFLHANIRKYCNRPNNADELTIKNWKHLVREQDTVIHLGDVIMGTKEKLTRILGKLPGTKILVRGNHDRNHSNTFFIDSGFNFVCEKILLSGVLLSHMPSTLNEVDLEKGIINVFGHFHNNPKNKWEKSLVERLTDNHYLLALEYIDYKPVLLSEIIKRKHVISHNNIKDLIPQKVNI